MSNQNIFFARGGNVNDQHLYATAPNVNTQRHLYQSSFYISYTSPVSILLQHGRSYCLTPLDGSGRLWMQVRCS